MELSVAAGSLSCHLIRLALFSQESKYLNIDPEFYLIQDSFRTQNQAEGCKLNEKAVNKQRDADHRQAGQKPDVRTKKFHNVATAGKEEPQSPFGRGDSGTAGRAEPADVWDGLAAGYACQINRHRSESGATVRTHGRVV